MSEKGCFIRIGSASEPPSNKSSEKGSEKSTERGSEKTSERILFVLGNEPKSTVAELAESLGLST